MNRKELIKALIETVDPNPGREGLADTPRRVDKAFDHLFSGYGKDLDDLVTVFDGEAYDEMIVVKNIEFYSFCEHHMLPFFGKAHIAYIPGDKIIGLSKMPRILDVFARRLQNQERITTQVADAIEKILKPKGVGVVISV
jgi:GTP cyclohydrolase I